ncbi:MAG: methylmalonyl-CoA/ethylmalonyl-CoA [Planctomycetota bacterium]|nr:MAG: methylmalonyl-CoA/ethylmalonyl-CoA [Planctomycetota bacterium]
MAKSSLNHVGIAVRKIEDALPLYRLLAPDAEVEYEDVPDMKVRVAKIHLANTCIELIEPLPGETAITKFLEKRGEGIHHVCLEVPDVDKATQALRASGCTPVYSASRPGSGGMRVNFLNPKGTRGVLFELNSRNA